jgi:hypothetical protein
MYGEQRQVIEVSDRISREDLRRRVSQEFAGRAFTVEERYPVRDGTFVNCIPSFVPEMGHLDEFKHTAVPYLVHGEKFYPTGAWENITFEDLVTATSNVMGCQCLLRTDTHFPVRTDDRILFVSEQMKSENLRKKDEIKT